MFWVLVNILFITDMKKEYRRGNQIAFENVTKYCENVGIHEHIGI